MKAMKWVSAAVAVLCLAGCGQVKGQIVEKSHSPAYTTTIVSCSKSCTVIPIYHPECWRVTVDNGGSACVTEQLWDSLPVGSYYDSETTR